jgi:hypothetical protein
MKSIVIAAGDEPVSGVASGNLVSRYFPAQGMEEAL